MAQKNNFTKEDCPKCKYIRMINTKDGKTEELKMPDA